MICEHCGAFYCRDYFDGGDAPQRYCDTRCRNAAKKARKHAHNLAHYRELAAIQRLRRRQRHADRVCQRKRSFPTVAEAAAAWRRLPGNTGGVYECGSHWHITARDAPSSVTPGTRFLNLGELR
jgi:hypothetical protein